MRQWLRDYSPQLRPRCVYARCMQTDVPRMHPIITRYAQGEKGDYFYIIKEGEAVVYQESEEGVRKVNHLFKADFFGEKALLSDEPRCGGGPCSPRSCPLMRPQICMELLESLR